MKFNKKWTVSCFLLGCLCLIIYQYVDLRGYTTYYADYITSTIANNASTEHSRIDDVWKIDWRRLDAIRIHGKFNGHTNDILKSGNNIDTIIKWQDKNYTGYCRHFLYSYIAFPYLIEPNTEKQLLFRESRNEVKVFAQS